MMRKSNNLKCVFLSEIYLKDIDFNKIALVFVMLFKINCIFADYKKNKHGVCVSYRGI
jgi:hypothetical protein